MQVANRGFRDLLTSGILMGSVVGILTLSGCQGYRARVGDEALLKPTPSPVADAPKQASAPSSPLQEQGDVGPKINPSTLANADKVTSIDPSFKIDELHLDYVRTDYHLDKFLNISATHHYRMNFAPEWRAAPLNGGAIQMTGFLFNASDDTSLLKDRVVATFTQDLNISRGGTVNAEISVTLDQKALVIVESHSTFAVDITYRDSSGDVKVRNIVEGPFPQADSKVTINLEQTSHLLEFSALDLTELTTRLEKSRATPDSLSVIDLYTKALKLYAPADKQLLDAQIPLDQIHNITHARASDVQYLKLLCGLLFEPKNKVTSTGALLWACQKNPLLYIDARRKSIVDSIDETSIKTPFGITNSNLAINASFSLVQANTYSHATGNSEDHRWTTSKTPFKADVSATLGVSGQLGANFFGNGGGVLAGANGAVGAGFAVTWSDSSGTFVSNTTSDATTKAQQSGGNLTRAFSVDQIPLQFRAAFKQCLVVQTLPAEILVKNFVSERAKAKSSTPAPLIIGYPGMTPIRNSQLDLEKGLSYTVKNETRRQRPILICDKIADEPTLAVEHYFFLSQQSWKSSSSLSYDSNPQNMKLATLVRGSENMQKLMQVLQDQTKSHNLTLIPLADNRLLGEVLKGPTNQEFPGLLSQPVIDGVQSRP